jgi:PQQ-like domain
MQRKARMAWWLVVVVGILSWPPARGEEADPLGVELKAAGIEPTRKGLEKFLEPMRMTPARLDHIRALLTDLGNDDFEKREKATANLIAMPWVPKTLLKDAAAKDRETEKRIEEILDDAGRTEVEYKVFLALRVIQANKIKGLAPIVLEMMPQWQEESTLEVAAHAVEASAERSDGKALRDVLARKEFGEARAAAVRALASVFGKEVGKELEGVLPDADSRVCLAAAIALLNQENRKPLAALARLLEADQAEVRLAAANILAEVSGKQIDFASYDEPKERAKGVAAWRDWVHNEGSSARLNLPVGGRRPARGRIVAAVFGENVLREVDGVTGKTLFEAGGFRYPWGAHATPEGHRLGVDLQASFVVEYNAQGKECWRQNVPGEPISVQRLVNGRTLVALAGAGKIVEIDRAGKFVWEVSLDGRPTTAQRLADGNTLVALQNAGKVVAVNRKGDVVWQIAGLGRPHTAEQLGNGHVLVCEFDRGVNEYDRAGKVVWSKQGVNNPAQAQRLANGNTLVSGADGLMEFDPKGKLIRHFRMGRSRFFAY